MSTYYYASTGSDSTGDGSLGNPWATENYALLSNRLSDGDVLIGLDTITANRTIFAVGGDITIGAETNAKLELPASVTTYLYNPDTGSTTFDGVEFSDPNSAAGYKIVVAYDGRTIVFDTVTVQTVNGLVLVASDVGAHNITVRDSDLGNVVVANITNADGYRIDIDNNTITDSKVLRWQGAAAGAGVVSVTNNVIEDSQDSPIIQGSYYGDVDLSVTGNVVKFASTDSNKVFLFPNNSLLGSGTGSLDCRDNLFWFSDGDQETITADAINYVFDSLYCSWRNYYLDPDSRNGQIARLGGVPTWGISHTLVGMGDSIIVGAGVASPDDKWWEKFNAATGYGLIVDNTTAINGLTMDGCLLNIDRCFAEYAPGYCFVAIGVNGSGELYDATYTSEQYANGIIRCLEKIRAYYSWPLWLGMEYTDSNATHMGLVDQVNGYVEAWCAAHGLPYANIAATMVARRPVDWNTYYYDDAGGIDGNVHPGVEGHNLIAELAELVFNQLAAASMVQNVMCVPAMCRPAECIPAGLPRLMGE